MFHQEIFALPVEIGKATASLRYRPIRAALPAEGFRPRLTPERKDTSLQYMALIYTDPSLTPQMGTSMTDAYFAYTKRARAAGVMKAGDALQPTSTATCVRVRGGKTETMDGPFAETKEHLGGYYLLMCSDLDEALKWAAQIPGAAYSTIEVRPLVVWG